MAGLYMIRPVSIADLHIQAQPSHSAVGRLLTIPVAVQFPAQNQKCNAKNHAWVGSASADPDS